MADLARGARGLVSSFTKLVCWRKVVSFSLFVTGMDQTEHLWLGLGVHAYPRKQMRLTDHNLLTFKIEISSSMVGLNSDRWTADSRIQRSMSWSLVSSTTLSGPVPTASFT
jgi:hypothetical protein